MYKGCHPGDRGAVTHAFGAEDCSIHLNLRVDTREFEDPAQHGGEERVHAASSSGFIVNEVTRREV